MEWRGFGASLPLGGAAFHRGGGSFECNSREADEDVGERSLIQLQQGVSGCQEGPGASIGTPEKWERECRGKVLVFRFSSRCKKRYGKNMASPSGDSHQCQLAHDYDHCNNGLGEHFNEDDGEDIMLMNDDGVIRV